MKAKGLVRILTLYVAATQNRIPVKGIVLAMVMLVLGGIISPCYGKEPPAIQLTPSGQFKDFVPSNGELGLYLVGFWSLVNFGGTPCNRGFDSNCRNNDLVDINQNLIFLVNPTSKTLWAFVTLWGQNEEPGVCVTAELSPNATATVQFNNDFKGVLHDVNAFVTTANESSQTASCCLLQGAVKVLSTNVLGQPEIGLVGYKQENHTVNCNNGCSNLPPVRLVALSESRLQPVPLQVLLQQVTVGHAGKPPKPIRVNELKKIKDLCQPVIIPPG